MKELVTNLIEENPGLTSKEAAGTLNLPYKSVRTALSKVKKRGDLLYADGAYYPLMPFVVRSGGKVLCSPSL